MDKEIRLLRKLCDAVDLDYELHFTSIKIMKKPPVSIDKLHVRALEHLEYDARGVNNILRFDILLANKKYISLTDVPRISDCKGSLFHSASSILDFLHSFTKELQ